jgi:outer membrane scaffolding protein for murein synthesis (MipA/OmpV family)
MASEFVRLIGAPLLSLALVSSPAAAVDTSSGPGTSDVNLKVGGFVYVAPKYEGGKEYEVRGFPLVAPSGYGISSDGRVQFRGPDDLRFRLIEFYGFEVGPVVGWRFGRDQDDASRLLGLGDVDGGGVVGGYAAYKAGWFKPYIAYNHQVWGDNTGGIFRFGAETTTDLAPGLSVSSTLGAVYADNDFMDSYFSVTPAQSAASVAGLNAYDAEAGIKSVFLGLTSDVPLSEVWMLKLSGRYSRLVGDAADSPIVESENQFYAGFGITYRFSFQR